ncbi:histidinol-phosphate transaminase [Polycladospora coralii]|uniref:histidinol-phosphate transaminase n=1 Tax=Polycladospora coralii TaxID=2771432 RepID=UPI003D30153E
MSPNEWIKDTAIYQPGKPLEEVKRELGLTEVIKMASNENPWGCSKEVWSKGVSHPEDTPFYPEGAAPDLTEKIAEHIETDPSRILLGNGTDEIVKMLAQVYLKPGKNAIMADFTFPRYEMVTKMTGADIVKVPLSDGCHDLKEMENRINADTQIVWICNPNNPTGTIVDRVTIESFLERIPPHVLVVMDEAYQEYVTHPDYPDTIALIDYNPQVIALRTFSKIYGLASFRIGYAVAHPSVIQMLNRVRDPFNTNRYAQSAALHALTDQTFVLYCRNQNRLGMKQITSQLEKWDLSYYPSQANFILIHTGFAGDDVFNHLLRAGIIVRSGQVLGYPTSIRVTIGTKEQNELFLQAFAAFLKEKGKI